MNMYQIRMKMKYYLIVVTIYQITWIVEKVKNNFLNRIAFIYKKPKGNNKISL